MSPAEARLREVPSGMTDAEWTQRVNLAAAYRLVALYGWDDLVDTHISARVPGPDHHFLINPYGLMFDEITASSLVKVDLHGNQLTESAYSIAKPWPGRSTAMARYPCDAKKSRFRFQRSARVLRPCRNRMALSPFPASNRRVMRPSTSQGYAITESST